MGRNLASVYMLKEAAREKNLLKTDFEIFTRHYAQFHALYDGVNVLTKRNRKTYKLAYLRIFII